MDKLLERRPDGNDSAKMMMVRTHATDLAIHPGTCEWTFVAPSSAAGCEKISDRISPTLFRASRSATIVRMVAQDLGSFRFVAEWLRHSSRSRLRRFAEFRRRRVRTSLKGKANEPEQLQKTLKIASRDTNGFSLLGKSPS
jgi:hypothetical protein